MNKKELLAMPKLKASSTMIRLAKADEPIITIHKDFWRNTKWESRSHKRSRYFRCCTQNGILKVACFVTESLRTGDLMPKYEIYFSKAKNTYLTYETSGKRWLTGCMANLDWPTYHKTNPQDWYSRETRKAVCRYFEVDSQNVTRVISSFQQGIMKQRLDERHRKETDPWDEDLKQTPELPSDWQNWVTKVGIPEHFIFYRYAKKKLQTGYCTFCEQEVQVAARHNKQGICPHCRKKVIFKTLGRFGQMHTEQHTMYLLQKCKDGFMIRQFEGSRFYHSGSYQNPEVRCREVRRVIGDHNGVLQRAYYHGDYKHVAYRWIEGNICACDYSGQYDGMLYGKTLRGLYRKELKTTGLKEYHAHKKQLDPEKYLSGYKRYPYFEKLAKVGLIRLIDEKTRTGKGYGYYSYPESFEVDSTQSSVIRLLMLTPSAFKRFRASDGTAKRLAWLQCECRTRKIITDQTIDWLIQNHMTPNNFNFIMDRMSVEQIVHYELNFGRGAVKRKADKAA